MLDVVPCRKCGAPTRLVVVAKSGKGLLVDATPRPAYVVMGVTKAGTPLVELRDTWVAHLHEPTRPSPNPSAAR
jgi:predicted proteasome-type protease